MQVEEQPDVAWVAGLAGVSEAKAGSSIAEAAGERQLFHYIEREHRQEGRTHYIEIDAPLELFALVRLRRPRHVVEVGVSSGVSSAYLLAALDRNERGTLHSVDLPKRAPATSRGTDRPSWSIPSGRSSGWAVPDRLRGRWDLRIGNKKDVLPLLAEELDRVDLFVYDVPHDDPKSLVEFRAIDPCLPTGGVVIVDHGQGGGLCPSLGTWAGWRDATPSRRTGTGLFGFRARSSARGSGASRANC
jgi:hypothetical protein